MDISSDEAQVKILGKRLDKTKCVCILRTRIWLENIFYTEKIKRIKLGKVLAKDGESTGIVLKWLIGRHCVEEGKVFEVEETFKGSSAIYFNPIFDLLSPKRLTRSKLNSLSSVYISEYHGMKVWDFPVPQQKENCDLSFPPTFINDSEMLLERGDFYGFFGLLYRFRMAEIEKDQLKLLSCFADLYRAVPGLCRTKEFKNHLKSILFCLQQFKLKNPFLILSIKSRYGVIRQQVRSKQHITRRALRPRDPVTQHFIELEKPYELSAFVSEL